MRELRIQIQGKKCHAVLLVDGGLLKAADIELNEPMAWHDLVLAVCFELRLSEHTPPGMPTVGENPDRLPWVPVMCGKPHAPGYGWGFLLPLPADAKAAVVSTETCCGFASAEGAARAARRLQEHATVIPQMPGSTYEVFDFHTGWAFADMHGEIHAGFSSRRHAQGCAVKTENTHWRAPSGGGRSATPPDVVIPETPPTHES